MQDMARYQANDLIYQAPPQDWWQSWLVGNGSGGATVWNPSDRICFQLGHTDLLDRVPSPGLDGRDIPNVRHAMRGSIQVHGSPLFDPFYIQDYISRTGLSDGIVRMSGKSQFGSFSLCFFYCEQPNVFVLRYADTLSYPACHSLCLEKLGSRFLPRIWGEAEPNTLLGLGNVSFMVQKDTVRIDYTYNQLHTTNLIEIRTGEEYSDQIGEYTLERTFPGTDTFEVELRICLGIGENTSESFRCAQHDFHQAQLLSFDQLLNLKTQQYQAQLPDTHIILPQDEYYENLWYACRYNMRSCYRGKYPAFFINGPFGGDRDKREWADCWLHWNMHASHLGIVKNGDFDLFLAYVEYKMRQIPSAQRLAREVYGCGGMVTQDQQKPDGGNRGLPGDYYKMQIHPCLQTSLQFYQYWRFTDDKTFLIEKLLPYMRLTLLFWKDYLKEENGHLHIPRSHPYEFHNGYAFRDCLVDLSLLKACLPIYPQLEMAAGLESPLAEWCKQALAQLIDFVSLPVLRDFVTRKQDGKYVYDNLFFRGEKYDPGDEVYSIGWSERVKKFVTHSDTHAEILEPDVKKAGGYGAFCSSQTSFVYPAALVCSDESPVWSERMHKSADRRKMWYNARNALRTIRRKPGRWKPHFPVEESDTMSWTGHSLELIAFAKLGLVENLRTALHYYTHNYQMYPQGMFNYHARSRWALDYQDHQGADGQPRRVYTDRLCRHFGFEAMGIFTETIDLMLLDSSDGILRLFPAYDRDAYIKLPGEGGFVVEAVQHNKQLCYVKITSLHGNTCRIRLAWDTCWCKTEKESTLLEIKNAVATFNTECGGIYIVSPVPDVELSLPFAGHTAHPHKNEDVTLGIFPAIW